MKKLSLDDMHELARSRGGECLSAKYANNYTKLRWRCNEGHEWKAIPGNIKSGSWCPVCANKRRNELMKLSMNDIQEFAYSRGGECLSDDYVNNSTKLRWRCKYNHEWEATYGSIKSGSWCPYCADCRQTIGDMQKLAHSRGGECLSTEYVNSYIKLRWRCEYGHEWEAIPYSVKTGHWCPYCASNIKQTIKKMQEIAHSRGGECLSDEYIDSKTKLRWRCADGHEWEAIPNSIKRGRWCPVCAHKKCSESHRLTIEEMQEIAHSRGGECLSTEYVDSKTKLQWKCERSHKWEAIPNSIKSGRWCPECAKNTKLAMTDMHELAHSRGGECLSDEYVNSSTKLRWRCKLGHEWEATPHSIKTGTWCPVCARKKMKQRP